MYKRIYYISGILSAEEKAQLKPSGSIKVGTVSAREFRCPKKGEWYLSGAIPQAYKAPNNLSIEFCIAKLVNYRKVVQYEIVE